MYVNVNLQIPKLIYDIYDRAAKQIGNCTTELVISCALTAYANNLFQEMVENGEIPSDHPNDPNSHTP